MEQIILNDKLKKLLEDKQISHEEFAALLNKSKKTINKIFKNEEININANDLKIIRMELNVNLNNYFFKWFKFQFMRNIFND